MVGLKLYLKISAILNGFALLQKIKIVILINNYALLVLEILKDKKKITNRFPGISDLSHKDTTSKLMQIGETLNSEEFEFVPPHFTFPQDRLKFEEYHKSHPRAIYIAKPPSGSEGNGIVLFQK